MPSTKSLVLAAALATSSFAAEVPLVTFDGADDTVALTDFFALVDPVMGGQSVGTWSTNATGRYGFLDGEVKDVPSLGAPGFVTAGVLGSFPDASVVDAAGGDLVLTVRSSTADYTGYRVSFAAGALSPTYSCATGGAVPGGRGCFKADFSVPAGDAFVEVRVPLASFSDKWNSATGQHTTECADDPDVCPSAASLADIQYFEVWGEGVDGVIHLELAAVALADAADGGAARAATTAAAAAVAPLTSVDVASYVGRWYQMYASITVKDTFQLGGNCVTADYGAVANESGVISVVNTVRTFGGRLPIVVSGYASQSPDTAGDLEVFLGPSADPTAPEPFADSNYWIIGVGPVDGASGQYDWATVSAPGLETLYVLARDVDQFAATYEADVLATLATQGFTGFLNKPRATNQEGCDY